MASLGMNGPYVLSPDKINEVVTKKSAGNFALGYIADIDFIVRYIGRADEDLNAILQAWIFRKSDCIFFKFLCADSSRAAFEKECRNYHDFGENMGLSNEKHPQRKDDTDWKCLACSFYG
ncbi:MAG: hypothetical protein KKB82_05360 [Candidatus Omnitrophica bacterium]|nr:hypothetical protein [Candidatus Omnitrophota bacterium]MBU1925333.1 hypothetical protein [Candidatus Omnitrophota bacterium]MBU2063824.1 hypothetical protein [Candidatus Omnitrophota bacterium]